MQIFNPLKSSVTVSDSQQFSDFPSISTAGTWFQDLHHSFTQCPFIWLYFEIVILRLIPFFFSWLFSFSHTHTHYNSIQMYSNDMTLSVISYRGKLGQDTPPPFLSLCFSVSLHKNSLKFLHAADVQSTARCQQAFPCRQENVYDARKLKVGGLNALSHLQPALVPAVYKCLIYTDCGTKTQQ